MNVSLNIMKDVQEYLIEVFKARDLYFCVGIIQQFWYSISHLHHFDAFVEKINILANQIKKLLWAFQA